MVEALRSKLPPPCSFLLTPQSTTAWATQGAATLSSVQAGGLSALPPSPCPPAPGSPPGWPVALLTSCSGHLLEPSIPRQQHSLSASHGASSPLLKGPAGVQKGSGQRRVHPRAWLPASLPPQGADGGQCWHLQEGLFWSFTCDPRWLRLPGGAQRHHLG